MELFYKLTDKGFKVYVKTVDYMKVDLFKAFIHNHKGHPLRDHYKACKKAEPYFMSDHDDDEVGYYAIVLFAGDYADYVDVIEANTAYRFKELK